MFVDLEVRGYEGTKEDGMQGVPQAELLPDSRGDKNTRNSRFPASSVTLPLSATAFPPSA